MLGTETASRLLRNKRKSSRISNARLPVPSLPALPGKQREENRHQGLGSLQLLLVLQQLQDQSDSAPTNSGPVWRYVTTLVGFPEVGDEGAVVSKAEEEYRGNAVKFVPESLPTILLAHLWHIKAKQSKACSAFLKDFSCEKRNSTFASICSGGFAEPSRRLWLSPVVPARSPPTEHPLRSVDNNKDKDHAGY